MTKQEIFDSVVKHLLSMKDRCAENGSCLYRGPNGAKCAAGFLLPDSFYSEDIEGCGVGTVPYFQNFYSPEELQLIAELQDAHDEKTNWDNGFVGFDCLKDIASCNKLEWNFTDYEMHWDYDD